MFSKSISGVYQVQVQNAQGRYREYSTTGPTNDSTGRSHVGTDVPYTYTSITQLVY